MATKAPIKLATDETHRGPIRVKFTAEALNAIQTPAPGGRLWVYDDPTRPGGIPGLALLITDRGARVFYLNRRNNGRPVRRRLGRLGELSIENARDLAAKLNMAAAAGENLMATKRALTEAVTLGDAFKDYAEHAKQTGKRSWKDDQERWRLYLRRWRGKTLDSISITDVIALHARIGEGSHIQANRTLALLSVIFSYSIRKEWIKSNPCKGVERFPEESRDRVLESHEAPAFFKALDAEPDETMRDLIRTLIFTGQRKSNVCSMHWKDIDMEGALWRIPKAQAKGKRAIVVTLNGPAMEILKRRRETTGGKGYVFPSRREGQAHITEPYSAWAKLLERAGIQNLRLHDLRRTLGSWMARANVDDKIIGAALGHRSVVATRIYTQINHDPRRRAVEAAGAAIQAAGEGKANVSHGRTSATDRKSSQGEHRLPEPVRPATGRRVPAATD